MKMDKNITKFLSWLFVILWLLIIFFLSSQPGQRSNNLSKGVIKQIVKATQKVIVSNNYINKKGNIMIKLNNLVREYAHAVVYLLLGILVINAFMLSGIKGYNAFIFSLIFCILYAASDEFHQLFVKGRGAEAADVFIDAIGALIGIGIYEAMMKVYFKFKTKPSR